MSRSLRRCAWIVASAAIASLVSAQAQADRSDVPPVVGYNYNEIETPRVAALGGAQRAFSNSLGALFTNPANMAASRVYHLGAFAQIWPESNRQSYGGAAVDSLVSSARLAGGLGATWTLQDPDGIDREAIDLRFALAFPFSDQFFVGLGGRYLWLSQDGLGPLGMSLASGGLRDERIVRGLGVDAGMTFRPGDLLSISVVGNNLNNPDHSFQPTTVGGGVGVGTEDFTVEADAVGDFTTWGETTVRAMGGFELLVGENFPLRAGYRYDNGADSHAISAGGGYVAQAFSAQAAVRRVVAGDEVTTIVLSVKYHVESSGLAPSPSDTF